MLNLYTHLPIMHKPHGCHPLMELVFHQQKTFSVSAAHAAMMCAMGPPGQKDADHVCHWSIQTLREEPCWQWGGIGQGRGTMQCFRAETGGIT